MAREIDEAWIEEAVQRYRRVEQLQAEFDKAVSTVEVVVTPAGEITDVRVLGPLHRRSNADLSRSVHSAVVAAADAARWAREKLHAETFGGYEPLRES